MRTNRKIALLASTALLLGGGFTISQKSSVTTPEQLVSQCPGGGYPILECEIINGKRVCRRQCNNYFSNG
ncbi:hypothetical protein [uncultured Nostoc sp.]|uniref:hypothetical protein n=1 Tax=uncultured Nostoc sp. TaxID=340711 RepID=UPI0035CB6FA0